MNGKKLEVRAAFKQNSSSSAKPPLQITQASPSENRAPESSANQAQCGSGLENHSGVQAFTGQHCDRRTTGADPTWTQRAERQERLAGLPGDFHAGSSPWGGGGYTQGNCSLNLRLVCSYPCETPVLPAELHVLWGSSRAAVLSLGSEGSVVNVEYVHAVPAEFSVQDPCLGISKQQLVHKDHRIID